MIQFRHIRQFLFVTLIILLSHHLATAQTTAFTYQGKLTDSGNLANGNYDLQFALFDALSGGTQQGTTQTVSNVTVTNGIFTVTLDFGACPTCFNGSARFLEIAVKPSSGGSFTTLSPRQPVTSAPYAINAAQLGGLAASGYLQNSTSQQASSNFNISGNGTAGGTLTGSIVNAVQQVNINGLRAFTVNGAYNDGFGTVFTASNTFAGDGAGVNTMPSGTLNNNMGKLNSFYGAGAGQQNTTGSFNSFFGTQAGQFNTTGSANAFFGSGAGQANTTANNNAFFGQAAGISNTTGSFNSFFGTLAGISNTTANNNSFFGYGAGQQNTAGTDNAFFGFGAGNFNTTGGNNVFFGSQAGHLNTTGQFNAFFGSSAGQQNTLSFGNSFFGYAAGFSNTSGTSNSFFGDVAGELNTTGQRNTFIGSFADFNSTNTTGNDNTLLGTTAKVTANLSNATAIGAFASAIQSNSLILGSINGVNSATADTFVGIGTTAPTAKLTVSGSGAFNASSADRFDLINTVFGSGYLQNVTDAGLWQLATTGGVTRMVVDTTGRIGIGTVTPQDALDVNGNIRINLGVGGDQPMCRGSVSRQVATCSSSLRYKTAVQTFTGGLAIINRLRPISFTWKQGGRRDIGLGAEEVEKVEPLLTFRNEKGEVEGVKYNQLSAVFINAFKEQQQQIENLRQELRQARQDQELIHQQQGQLAAQQQQIQQQQQEMTAIKKLLCQSQPKADLCKVKSLK